MTESEHSNINIPIISLIISYIITFSVAAFKGLTLKRSLLAFIVGSGLGFIIGGLGHIFSPTIVAEGIGWPVSPYFQYEVGIANIMVGVLCIGTIFFNDDWILASIVAMTIWGYGNMIGHLISFFNDGNKNPGNIGWVLYLSTLTPIIGIILFILYKYNES